MLNRQIHTFSRLSNHIQRFHTPCVRFVCFEHLSNRAGHGKESYVEVKEKEQRSSMSGHAEQEDSRIMTAPAAAQTLPAYAKGPSKPSYSADDEGGSRPEKKMAPRKVDSRSPEYLLKSGFAGGLAGCAVRLPHLLPCLAFLPLP